MRICVVWPEVAPCRVNENAPFAVAQSASVAAMGTGSVVCRMLAGWVRNATATRRTFVSGPAPLFSTVKVDGGRLAVVEEGVAVAAGERRGVAGADGEVRAARRASR